MGRLHHIAGEVSYLLTFLCLCGLLSSERFTKFANIGR